MIVCTTEGEELIKRWCKILILWYDCSDQKKFKNGCADCKYNNRLIGWKPDKK